MGSSEKLIFESFDGKPYMTLDRGKEVRHGVVRPKPGSGPYEYILIGDDTIAVRWLLSSNSNYAHYPFKRSGNTFVIGKFFGDTADNLTFIKVD